MIDYEYRRNWQRALAKLKLMLQPYLWFNVQYKYVDNEIRFVVCVSKNHPANYLTVIPEEIMGYKIEVRVF